MWKRKAKEKQESQFFDNSTPSAGISENVPTWACCDSNVGAGDGRAVERCGDGRWTLARGEEGQVREEGHPLSDGWGRKRSAGLKVWTEYGYAVRTL